MRALLLVAVLAVAVALVLLPGRRTREDPAAVLDALRAAAGPVLPAATVAGAEGASPAARYVRDTLYELVDGAAEGYLGHGFERCVASVYTFPGGVEVAAEAHRFAAPGGAQAQLATEQPASARPLAGLAAVGDEAVLLAVQGRDLLKLTSLTPDARGHQALRRIAASWLARAPGLPEAAPAPTTVPPHPEAP